MAKEAKKKIGSFKVIRLVGQRLDNAIYGENFSTQ